MTVLNGHRPDTGSDDAVDRALVDRLRREVGDELHRRVADHGGVLDVEDRRMLARALIGDRLRDQTAAPLTDEAHDAVTVAVLDELFGLGRLQRLIDDPDVTDIAVNGCDTVWVTYRGGAKHSAPPVAGSDAELVELIQAAARRGRSEARWDPGAPMLDLQLPSGDRLNAIAWVAGRPSVSIRRHDFSIHRLDQLIERGTASEALAALLSAMVRARFNVVVAGGTGAGKTTVLRCLINEIPAGERLVTVEDSLELGIDRFADLHPDLVDLEARAANVEGVGAVSMNDLAINALRMNPDRLIVGEVRGDEALTLLLACTQGNDGALCTIHADSSEGVFGRLRMYLAMTRERFAPTAANLMTAQALDAVVHLAQLDDGSRVVTSVREVVGTDGDMVVSNEISGPDRSGRATPRFGFSAERLARLERVGFHRALLDATDRWPGSPA